MSAVPQVGHGIIVVTTVELIGIAAFTALAGMNDDLGTVMVVIMWGVVIGWLMLNSSTLSSWVSKA